MAYEYDEKAGEDMARKFGQNATEDDVRNVRDNMGKMNRGPLKAVWDKVKQLWQAFLSPDTPAYKKAIIIGSLIYMVSPIDLIPDVIPVVGLTDDVAVILNAFRLVIGIAGATYVAIKIVHLTRKSLKAALLKHNANAVAAQIKELYQNNDYNVAKVGLLDEEANEIEETEIQYETRSVDINEGDYIQLLEYGGDSGLIETSAVQYERRKIYCSECGTKLADNAIFCPECGKKR